MEEIQPRDPHPGASFDVARTLISSYIRAVDLDERIARAAVASQYEAIEQARAFAVNEGRFSQEFAIRSLTAEIATTLGLHEATAVTLIHEAEALVHHFPTTLRSLSEGSISRQHVRLLLHEAWSLPLERRGEFERLALPLAQDLAPTRFRREARKLRERMHTESMAERLRLERAERKVTVEPGRDGMSWLTLYLPTDQVAAISARLDFMGRRTASDDDPRTRAQREADIASDLLQHGTVDRDVATSSAAAGSVGSVRPTIFVTVPVLTLLGRSDEPASLEGFGPIDPDTARELAGDAASFFRILTHPETGTWMSYGRDAYKVPADLQRFIRLRDGVCRFPGCTHRAITGENDHTVDWQDGGHTSVENLASLCKKHHRLKHNSDWRVAQLADGIIEWTSPAGRTHRTSPDSDFGGIHEATPARPTPARPTPAWPTPARPKPAPPERGLLPTRPSGREGLSPGVPGRRSSSARPPAEAVIRTTPGLPYRSPSRREKSKARVRTPLPNDEDPPC